MKPLIILFICGQDQHHHGLNLSKMIKIVLVTSQMQSLNMEIRVLKP